MRSSTNVVPRNSDLRVGEKSQIQALDRSQPILPMMLGMAERRTHHYARTAITSLVAAFNIAVATELHRRHRALAIQIERITPITSTLAAQIVSVFKNWATQKFPNQVLRAGMLEAEGFDGFAVAHGSALTIVYIDSTNSPDWR